MENKGYINIMESFIPSLIILWISQLIFLPLVAWAFKTKNTNWGRFWGIWFFSSLLSGIVLTGLILAPDFVSNTIDKIKSFIL